MAAMCIIRCMVYIFIMQKIHKVRWLCLELINEKIQPSLNRCQRKPTKFKIFLIKKKHLRKSRIVDDLKPMDKSTCQM